MNIAIKSFENKIRSLIRFIKYYKFSFEKNTCPVMPLDQCSLLTGEQLGQYFLPYHYTDIQFEINNSELKVTSNLADGDHAYIYAKQDIKYQRLQHDKIMKCYLETSGHTLVMSLAISFLDAHKNKIGSLLIGSNRFAFAQIPPQTKWLRIGLRIFSSGNNSIKTLTLGHHPYSFKQPIFAKGQYLLLTNGYPSKEKLYSKPNIHNRVKAYREAGLNVDVFQLCPDEEFQYCEFDNVIIMQGNQQVLDQLLSVGQYRQVLVHFHNKYMWDVIQQYIATIPVTIWLHGSEIQSSHRRDYSYKSEEERALAKIKSDKRMDFWKSILQPMPENLHLVFVSQHFANEVQEDLGFKLPENKISVIHNPINTNLFTYEPKNPEQRKKILSVKSYASLTYANDLSVACILILSKQPWFNEIEFTMIGDGTLFDQTLAPLAQFKNVHIEKRFLTHPEIAQLHKEYGIFLTPTRMDSHGISRDEAMSSGLVPITNSVAAIPEFTDETCAILAPSEDAQAMAMGIIKLYEDPKLFTRMSAAAAQRIRSQNTNDIIISKIINFIKNNDLKA